MIRNHHFPFQQIQNQIPNGSIWTISKNQDRDMIFTSNSWISDQKFQENEREISLGVWKKAMRWKWQITSDKLDIIGH